MPYAKSVFPCALVAVTIAAASPIAIDGSAAWHRWDGLGGLSAGASSRLLVDYPEPQRSDILDFLYKPGHGAGLKICKVEIGGDVMSTDGAEASHEHSRGDLSCDRGYEFWLASEALKRNPNITTYGLSWGVPGWVGNGTFFSVENMAYQAAFCTCFEQKVGQPLDYIGIWNERYWGGADYIVSLRAALDSAGHAHVGISLPDASLDPEIIALLQSNTTFSASVAVVGLHSEPAPAPVVEATGHKYWRSETGFAPVSLASDWEGAQGWASQLSRTYVAANVTASISWSTIWSVLPGLPYDGRGIMMANTPWSGNYAPSAPVWVSAHWGQFAEPGWRFLLAGRGSGLLPVAGQGRSGGASGTASGGASDGGSYVSLVPPASNGSASGAGAAPALTLIVETMGLPGQALDFQLIGTGLPSPGTPLHVWSTTNASRFVQLPDVVVGSDGTFSIAAPPDGIITVSTIDTASHGLPSAPIPSPAPLALPYADNFSEATYAYDSYPRFLSDQGGCFVARNGSLVQTAVGRPGANDWYTTPDPITLLGDYTPWANVSISALAFLPQALQQREGHSGADSSDDPNARVEVCDPSPGPESPQVWVFDSPAPGYVSNTVTGASTCLNLYGCQPRLIYYQCCIACGCYDGQGFDFTLQPNGSLTAALLPGLCAGLQSDNTTVSMVPCAPAALTQYWARTGAGQLVNAAAGGCLTSQLVPEFPYVRVCVRVTAYTGFAGLAPVPGYCLALDSSGAWAVTAGNATIANGTTTTFDPAVGHSLKLAAVGGLVSAAIDGVPLGSWMNGAFTAGMVALGSGVHAAAFDDLLVAPA